MLFVFFFTRFLQQGPRRVAGILSIRSMSCSTSCSRINPLRWQFLWS